MTNPTPLFSKPGIKRDGTRFDNDYHVDGQWVRWHRGRARKMLGYQRYSQGPLGISRGLHGASRDGSTYVHSGSASKLEQLVITGDNAISPSIDRTPAAFVASADNIWTFAASYDAVTKDLRLLAHAAPNARAIDSATKAKAYYCLLTDGSIPTAVVVTGDTPEGISGSVWQIGPYAFAGNSDGQINWSVANKPSDFTNTGSGVARPTYAKFLAGRRLRGAGVYAGLAWSLDTLVRITFNGGATIWNFEEVATTFLLGPQAHIEADGLIFWIDASRRFMVYNGQPTELPNPMNLEYFFDNLNWTYRGRVHGYYNARWGEIVWHAPLFGATECNWAIIYNVREQTWYDTPLPNGGRSAAIAASIYRWPIMGGIAPTTPGLTPQYDFWQHEIGTDEVDGDESRAVKSYFITGDISMLKAQQPSNDAVSATMIEPDLDQVGAMTVTVTGNKNARGPEQLSDEVFTITPSQQAISVKEERRQMRFRFESNTLLGNFEMGRTMVQLDTTKSGVLD